MQEQDIQSHSIIRAAARRCSRLIVSWDAPLRSEAHCFSQGSQLTSNGMLHVRAKLDFSSPQVELSGKAYSAQSIMCFKAPVDEPERRHDRAVKLVRIQWQCVKCGRQTLDTRKKQRRGEPLCRSEVPVGSELRLTSVSKAFVTEYVQERSGGLKTSQQLMRNWSELGAPACVHAIRMLPATFICT